MVSGSREKIQSFHRAVSGKTEEFLQKEVFCDKRSGSASKENLL